MKPVTLIRRPARPWGRLSTSGSPPPITILAASGSSRSRLVTICHCAAKARSITATPADHGRTPQTPQRQPPVLIERDTRRHLRHVLGGQARHAEPPAADGARRMAHDVGHFRQQRAVRLRHHVEDIGPDAVRCLGKVLEHDPVQEVAEIVFFAVAGHGLDQNRVGIELLRLDNALADRHLRGEAGECPDFGQDGLGVDAARLPDLLGHQHRGDAAPTASRSGSMGSIGGPGRENRSGVLEICRAGTRPGSCTCESSSATVSSGGQ